MVRTLEEDAGDHRPQLEDVGVRSEAAVRKLHLNQARGTTRGHDATSTSRGLISLEKGAREGQEEMRVSGVSSAAS